MGEVTASSTYSRSSTWNRNISIVGFDKCKCIVKNTKGLYATGSEPGISEYVDNACFILSGNIYIANLTIISTDEDFPEELEDGLRRSYCVHIDGDAPSGAVAEVHNCILKNTHSACIGVGLRNNTEVRVTDCICESDVNPALDEMMNKKYFGVVQGHDNNSLGADTQKFVMKNNIFKNTGTGVGLRFGTQADATPCTLVAVGNAFRTKIPSETLQIGPEVVIDDINFGNSEEGLNYNT